MWIQKIITLFSLSVIFLSSFSPFAYWIISNAPLFLCLWPFLFCLQIICQAFKSFPSSSLILSSNRFFLWEIWAWEPQQESVGTALLVALELCRFFQARIWLKDFRSVCLADVATLQGPCCAKRYLQRPFQMLVHTGSTDNPNRQGERAFSTTRWQNCRCLCAGFWSSRRPNSLDLTLLSFSLPQTGIWCLWGYCFLPSAANWSSIAPHQVKNLDPHINHLN